VAILVLILGLFLANFVSQVLVTYLKNIEIDHAETICKIIKYVVIIFVLSVTFNQLNIAKELVTNTFLIAFGAICLALALAFGLGAKEWAAEIIKKIAQK
jgi:small-conductance mechanosensitive channel